MAPLARTLGALLVPATVVLGGGVLAGCGSSSSSGEDPPPVEGPKSFADFELFPSTRLLAKDDVASLAKADEDGTLVFTAPTPTVASLAVGNVLLAPVSETTPQGLLRVVLATDHDASGALVLTTAAAPLQLAFKRLHALNVGTIDPMATGSFRPKDLSPMTASPVGARLTPQWTAVSTNADATQSYEIIVFDGDGNPATTNDQVKIDARLGGGFHFELAIDVDWGAVTALPDTVTDCLKSLGKVVVGKPPSCSVDDFLPELKLVFEADPHLAAKITASGAASLGFEKSFEIGTIDLPPIAIGPLVFLPSADVVATVTGKASARFEAGAHADVSVLSKATLSSKAKNTKLEPFTLEHADAGADTPEVDLYASVAAKVGVRLNLPLYGIAGPYATASAVAQLDANPVADPCWALRLGLEAELGVRVTSPRLPLLGYVTFLDWHADPWRPFEKVVASGTCTTTPEGANPPGGGPGAKTLQSPPFEPWAKVLAAPVDASNAGDVAAFTTAFPFLAPSIDGRWVAAGGGALGLFKIDDRGGGSLTWTRQVTTDGARPQPLRSLASVPSLDAGLVTLYAPVDTNAFVLAKQGQSGEEIAVMGYALGEGCVAVPRVLARDRGDGFVVAGSCRSSAKMWIAHLDASLGVVRTTYLSDPDPAATRLAPTVAVRVGDDLVLAGDRSGTFADSDTAQTFVLRLDDAENVALPITFGCPQRAGILALAGAPSADGSVTLVGDATGVPFVMRVKKDDTVGFVTFPQLGVGVRDWFVPGAVAELPTTGLVVALSNGVLGAAPPVVTLLGLDGAGHTQWASDYALSDAGGPRAVSWPALRITDDGGVLVTAYAGPESGQTSGGALVAMKVFAKDGFLGDGFPLKAAKAAPAEGTYALTTHAFAPATAGATLTAAPFPHAR